METGLLMVSFVIPCYRSEKTIENVVKEIDETMVGKDYEIILVNDSSPDNTFSVIESLCKSHDNITGVNLNQNYGQHAALMAGFHYVSGDIVVCLDDDGQTPANEANKLIDALDDNVDVAYAKYDHKKHSAFRNLGSRVNELMLRFILSKPKDLFISSYFAVKRFIVDEMIKYTNPYPYVIGLVLRSTNKIVNVPVNHRARTTGESGYTLGKLINLWLNGFTAFSIKPLRIATGVGGIMALGSFIYGIVTIIMKIAGINEVLGFSAIIATITFLSGVNLVMLGMIGEYIGRIYISLNQSPQYIVREVKGKKGTDEKN